MAMTYTTLTGAKGSAGSIMNWVSYSKLDIVTVVDEAQSLLYQMLRVREMRAEWVFGLGVGYSEIALPARFLDPIGRMNDVTNGGNLGHKIETDIQDARAYDAASGSFGASPFTTTNGASTVSAVKASHGITQGSTVTIAGAIAVGGLTLNGTFPVTSITDANTLVFDAGDAASSTATGGGSSATYTANVLISGQPSRWTIFDEKVKFDCATDTATQYKQLYYRAPALLSSSNLSNWLTNRYPVLMRKACQVAAADFMKDDTEYQKQLAALQNLIQSTAAENDLSYRGAEFGTDTP